jgi:hypothetical protein
VSPASHVKQRLADWFMVPAADDCMVAISIVHLATLGR